jgi:hypothetical protein
LSECMIAATITRAQAKRTGQLDAIDAVLLAGAHTHSLPVHRIAHRVRLARLAGRDRGSSNSTIRDTVNQTSNLSEKTPGEQGTFPTAERGRESVCVCARV